MILVKYLSIYKKNSNFFIKNTFFTVIAEFLGLSNFLSRLNNKIVKIIIELQRSHTIL